MKKRLSIVIPVYNEEKNIPLIYDALEKILASLKKYEYEIIFVNDGSEDKTWEKIKVIHNKNPRVKGVNLAKNFGHATALQAGLEIAKGDAIIMMDGDLQHPPQLISTFIERWEKGHKIVNTLRTNTEGITFLKKFSSEVFYKTFNSLSLVKLNFGESDFRLIDNEVLRKINKLPESPKFYRGIVHNLGYKISYISYKAEKRKYGKTSYSLLKMIELAILGMASFSHKSLRFFFIFLKSIIKRSGYNIKTTLR